MASVLLPSSGRHASCLPPPPPLPPCPSYGGDEADLTQGMRNWLAYNLFRAAGRYATRTVWWVGPLWGQRGCRRRRCAQAAARARAHYCPAPAQVRGVFA